VASRVNREQVLARISAALRDAADDPALAIAPGDRLVDDLGFDSTGIASLTIALEEVFDEVLLLNDWITSASSPSELTVASLVDYVSELLGEL
jgi:acyl carrier protein